MYFLFHMLNGARGAVSLIKLTKSSYEIERELANIKEDNSFLQNKIRLLQNDNLDLDLLEELAYNILGFAKAENMIMLLPR